MKSKVDPLMRLLDHRLGEASRALIQARQKLEGLEAERDWMEQEIRFGEARFDAAQHLPLAPEEHSLHQHWLDRMRVQVEAKKIEITAQQAQVEACREVLAGIHIELKTLEKYKENLEERLQAERKAREAKELDEIAGQKHSRQAE